MCLLPSAAWGQAKSPQVSDTGNALVVRARQLFIDNFVIAKMDGVRKVLNQPVKHPSNPILRKHKREYAISYGSVLFDPRDKLYKLWHQIWSDPKDSIGTAGYAISKDGIKWTRPITNRRTGLNLAQFAPREPWVGAPGIIIDPRETNPARRFKMLYLAKPKLNSKLLCSSVAYSADGIHWQQEKMNPVAPYSDTQISPYWDARRGRYVAYCRTGPPNVRNIARIESSDFIHWSPKVAVVKMSNLDRPFNTNLYTMTAMPYQGVYIGLITTYHGETIRPIPANKLWMDRVDAQLSFSRNGLTWQRVIKDGALTAAQLKETRDWKKAAEGAAFLPYGRYRKDWDWGQIYVHHPPLVVGDEIRFYYSGLSNRHWEAYHKDKANSAIGMATLRLDGFVSVEGRGTLTTKPLVFFGDTLRVNANAKDGTLRVAVLDANGAPIKGFGSQDCLPITTDGIRHVVKWRGVKNCQAIQGKPVVLQFSIDKAKLYSFESVNR